MSAATEDTELGEEGMLARVKAAATIILDEYLICESSVDAALFVEDLRAPQYHGALMKRVLTTAMDKTEADQEKACTLVSSLCVRGVVEEKEVEAGLEMLIKSLPDLGMDVPRAVEYAARYLSHFLEDKIVPETILASLHLLAGAEMGAKIKALVAANVSLPLPVTTTKANIRSLLQEYFVSGSLEGALKDLAELQGQRPGQECVKRVLVMGLEKKNREKEMASVLLSAMTPIYGSEQFFEGFTRVLKDMDDLSLDNPDVVPMVCNFIARAMVDDVLPPGFFDFLPLRLLDNERVRMVAASVSVLMQKHSSTRLMNIWGGGAKNSVQELKASVNMLVQQYFVEGELDEALDAVKQLDAPHFGHEVVKRVVYQAVERGDDTHLRRAMALLKALLETSILDQHQLTLGMQRCVEGLPDLTIDVPSAAEQLRTMADRLAFEHLVSPAFEQAVLLKAKQRAATKAPVTPERVQAFASFIVEEYLVCQSARDAATSVFELQASGQMHGVLVHSMILIALDKTVPEQGMVGELVSSLVVRDVIAPSAIEAGMELLLKQLSDLVIDVPKVLDYVAPFLAHLIEDGHVQQSILDQAGSLAGAEMGAEMKSRVGALVKMPLPSTTMKLNVRRILDDYFACGDLHSAVAHLAELEGKRPGQEAVKRTLVLALEMKNSQKERASVLLSALTRVYGTEQFFEGFIGVLKSIDDLALDTPDVVRVLALFIARAMLDDVLPPAFISFLPPRVVAASERVRMVQTQVEQLMAKGGSTRVVNAWGASATCDVDELKDAVKALVHEYFVANELEEAVRCVHELDAADFGHEIVKRTVFQALELGREALPTAVVLLQTLLLRQAIQASQITKGMVRAVLGLRDLSLDVPAAESSLLALLNLMLQDKLITQEFKDKAEHMSTAVATPSS